LKHYNFEVLRKLDSMNKLNKYSKTVTQDPTQPAAQAMLYAIGLTTEDFFKPLVGIASTGYEGNPCNMHLNDLAKLVKDGTKDVDVIGLIFNTIGVSDGISMGTPGMRYSLPSRDLIADSMDIKKAFIGLHEKLKTFEDHPYEKRAFLYLDIISWLESKIDNKPVGQVVKEKYFALTEKP